MTDKARILLETLKKQIDVVLFDLVEENESLEEESEGPYRRLNPPEIKAVKELQELYEYKWNKGEYEECDTLLGVFCILNKHLTGHTGWRIDFEGSKAKELENPRIEHKGLSYIPEEEEVTVENIYLRPEKVREMQENLVSDVMLSDHR